jgi:hypothetical protein
VTRLICDLCGREGSGGFVRLGDHYYCKSRKRCDEREAAKRTLDEQFLQTRWRFGLSPDELRILIGALIRDGYNLAHYESNQKLYERLLGQLRRIEARHNAQLDEALRQLGIDLSPGTLRSQHEGKS